MVTASQQVPALGTTQYELQSGRQYSITVPSGSGTVIIDYQLRNKPGWYAKEIPQSSTEALTWNVDGTVVRYLVRDAADETISTVTVNVDEGWWNTSPSGAAGGGLPSQSADSGDVALPVNGGTTDIFNAQPIAAGGMYELAVHVLGGAGFGGSAGIVEATYTDPNGNAHTNEGLPSWQGGAGGWGNASNVGLATDLELGNLGTAWAFYILKVASSSTVTVTVTSPTGSGSGNVARAILTRIA